MASSPEPDSEPDFESAVGDLEDLRERVESLSIQPADPLLRSAVQTPSTQLLVGGPTQPPIRSWTLHQRDANLTIIVRPAATNRPLRRINLEPIRYYAVWEIPRYVGSVGLVGVHSGHGTLAYEGILEANGWNFSGIRFRRAETLVAAERLFASEARARGSGSIARFSWE